MRTRAHRLLTVTAFACLAASASAVDLGGANVPRDKLVVYLFIGHSNMEGGADTIKNKHLHPRTWNFRVDMNRWIPAEAPIYPNAWNKGTRMGPGAPFLERMAQLYPQHYIGIIQNARAGAGIRMENKWGGLIRRYWPGTPHYDQLIEAARRVQKQGIIGGVVAMLGRTESANNTYARTFSDDVKFMVEAMRKDLGIPDLPYLNGMAEVGATWKYAYWGIVRDETEKIPAKLSRAAIIRSDGPHGKDGYHYTYEGQVKWGRTAAELIKSKGWFPVAQTPGDTTPPRIVSVSAGGSVERVRVVFSEALARTGAEKAANYALDRGATVLSAALESDLETVTLVTSPLGKGVTYTLTVTRVTDRAPQPNAIAPNTSVKFSDAGGVNQSPQVDAGVDGSVTLGEGLDLPRLGSITDDGLPGGPLSFAWSQPSGPAGGQASFSAPNREKTAVTFDTPGNYVLRLTVSDGALQSHDEVTVTVSEPVSVTLLAPNGGEAWPVRSTQFIRWEAKGIDALVLRYSTDDGQTWKTIADSVERVSPDWGRYSWIVPDESSDRVRVLLAGYFDAAGGVQSAAPFAIVGSGPDERPPDVTVEVLRIGGRVDDTTVTRVSLGGSAFAVTGGTFACRAALPATTSTLQLTAGDGAGNTATRILKVLRP